MNFYFGKKNWIVFCKWVLYNKVEKEIDRMQDKVYNTTLMGEENGEKSFYAVKQGRTILLR